MKKIIEFLIKNKYIIGTVIIYIFFVLQMQNVHLYADDYTAIYPNGNVYLLIKERILNLFNFWSGRIIGHTIVVSGLSLFGIQFYRILHPIFFFFFCLFISKIIKLKLNIDLKKIMFFVSLFIVGFDILLNNEFIYWAYGGILYFWGYVFMLVILYFILDCNFNNKKLNNFRFLISIIFLFIVNFMMETTMIFLTIFLFFCILYNIKNKRNDAKIIILFTFCVILLGLTIFIPGNLKRLSFENSTFFNLNLLIDKIISTMKFVIFPNGISNIVSISSIILCLTCFTLKKEKYVSKIVFIINILFIINFRFFNIFNFTWDDSSIFLYIISFTYFILNIYMLMKIKQTIDFNIVFLVISGIATTIINLCLISYQTGRFYYILLITLIIMDIYLYYNSNEKNKKIISLFLVTLMNFYLGLLLFIIFKFFDNRQMLKIIITCIIVLNMNNFAVTFYKYYQNAIIFEDNIDKIIYCKKNKIYDIKLKKLKYLDYAFHMPEQYDYMKNWYSSYYGIEKFNITYE